jgi:hypothetical protein
MSNYTVNSSCTTEGTENTTYEESCVYDYGTTTGTVSCVTADGNYMLIEASDSPYTKPEAFLGFGEIRSGDTEYEFWGLDTSIIVYIFIINSDGSFTIQSGASVTIS